jgi:exonuclease III
MKFLSFNYKGVVIPSKKYSITRLVFSNKPDIIFFQETMGNRSYVSSLLESLLKQWIFSCMDTKGHFVRLKMGWNPKKVKIQNLWGLECVIGECV